VESTMVLKILTEASLKGSVLVGAAGLATLLLWRQSASTRSLVWTAVVALLVLLPVLAAVPPAWQVPLIPDFLSGQDLWARLDLDNAARQAGDADSVSGAAAAGPPAEGERASGMRGLGLSALDWGFLIWASGAVAFLVWFLVGRTALWWIARKAAPVTDGPWVSTLERVGREMRIRRAVTLLKSPHVALAFTTGFRRPAMVLPAAADAWPPENVRSVVLHEMAHVKRRDTISELAAQLATALYWFHPLVWWVVHRLRVERERACDDVVLTSGSRPSDYASQLLDVARSLSTARTPLWQAAAISQGGSLKDRLLCILDPKRKRTPAERWAPWAVGVLVAAIVVPLVTLTPWVPAAEDVGPAAVLTKTPDFGSLAFVDLVEKYKTGRPEIREAAVRALGDLGTEDAHVILRKALADPDISVRKMAMKLLAGLGDVSSVAFFVESLFDAEMEVRAHAALCLTQALDREHPEARSAGLEAIEAHGYPETFAAYAEALGSLEPEARAWAGKALVKRIWGEDPKMRWHAVNALGERQDPEMTEALVVVSRKDEHPKIRVGALKWLSVLIGERDDALKGVILALEDEDPMIRRTAAGLLGEIADPRARPFLEAVAKKDEVPEVRKAAKKALASLPEDEKMQVSQSQR